MAKKALKPETQAVLMRVSIAAFQRLREEAIEAKRSIGSQAAVIIESRYTQPKQEVSA